MSGEGDRVMRATVVSGWSRHFSAAEQPLRGLENYTFQVRAIGGSSGYSDWSDPVSHMSM